MDYNFTDFIYDTYADPGCPDCEEHEKNLEILAEAFMGLMDELLIKESGNVNNDTIEKHLDTVCGYLNIHESRFDQWMQAIDRLAPFTLSLWKDLNKNFLRSLT